MDEDSLLKICFLITNSEVNGSVSLGYGVNIGCTIEAFMALISRN